MTAADNTGGFYGEAGDLYTMFQCLIRDARRLAAREKTEGSDVYKSMWTLVYNLYAHYMVVRSFYPLCKIRGRIIGECGMTDPDIQETMMEGVDMSTRAWFVTMCGFGFEKIIVEIAKRNDIKHDRLNIKPKFKGVLDKFKLTSDERLNLVDIFYHTRNTLHDGGVVSSDETFKYRGRKFEFTSNGVMRHADWGSLIFLAEEIIRMLDAIIESETASNEAAHDTV
ncbi:MAG: hypothetical protein MPL62_04195 [Alphaproteobacteria bacterium]|nr:hypothetical protein [Alphaproteobacteria bacterium]